MADVFKECFPYSFFVRNIFQPCVGPVNISSREWITTVKANAEESATGKIQHIFNNSYSFTRTVVVKLNGIARAVFNIVTNIKHLENAYP